MKIKRLELELFLNKKKSNSDIAARTDRSYTMWFEIHLLKMGAGNHGVNQSGGTFELSTPRDSAKYAGKISKYTSHLSELLCPAKSNPSKTCARIVF
jgi:hypothetical protein